MSVECLKCLLLSNAALGNFYVMSRMFSESLGIYGGVLGELDGVGEAQGGVWYYFTFNFLKFQEVTNQILYIFQLT